MSLPVIEHATVTLNENNRVVIRMDDGWVFYRLDIFPEDTPAEEIAYSYEVYIFLALVCICFAQCCLRVLAHILNMMYCVSPCISALLFTNLTFVVLFL